MTSKKSLLMMTGILFISLCSPIKAEMSWQEYFVRGVNYGFCCCMPYFISNSIKKDFSSSSAGVFFNFEFNDELRGVPERMVLGGTGVCCHKLVNKFVVDKLFSEGDIRKLGNKRFVSDVSACIGAMLGDYDSKCHPLGSFIGAALFGVLADYTLNKKYNFKLFQQLKKNTEEKSKKRKEHEATRINNEECHDE